MFIEIVVFSGQHGQFHDIGNFVETHDVASFFTILGQQDLVFGIDAQGNARPVIGHGLKVGQVRPGKTNSHDDQQGATKPDACAKYDGFHDKPSQP